jgi:hypothetical protein
MLSNFVKSALVLSILGAALGHVGHGQVPNDSCATAMVVGDGSTPGTNAGASTGPDPLPSCPAMLNDVWFSYTASCTGTAIVSFCAPGTANFDTVLAAWSGSCGCLNELACNDDFCGTSSRVVFPVVAGTTYYISAGSFDGSVGSFTLNIMCGAVVPPPVIPANDFCSGAQAIAEGVVTPGTSVNASTGGGGCPGDPSGLCSVVSNDVWYSFFASCSGPYEARTCVGSTAFDTVVTVWDGSAGCGSLVEVACNDDNFCGIAGQGLSSIASWNATAGTLYYVSVGGFLGATGSFDLLVGPPSALTLTFTSSGPNTLGYTLGGGPPFGFQFTAISTVPGAFPNGSWFGISITNQEIINQITFGYPFVTLLGPCGEAVVPPFGPLPAGFTVYGVSLAAPIGFTTPTHISPPVSGTVF